MIPILLSITIIIGVYLIELKKNVQHHCSFILSMFFFFFLMGGNYQNADYDAYRYSYYNSSFENVNFAYWAYNLSMYFFSTLGISFISYRLLLYAIGLIFISFTVKKVSGPNLLFSFFYFLYPMIIDATQMKNFLAMSIFSFALTFLSENLLGKIKYTILLLLAGGFHIAIFAFFPLVIFKNFILSKNLRYFFIPFIFIAALFMSTMGANSVLLNYLSSLMINDFADKQSLYFNQSVNYGFLIYFFATTLNFFVVCKAGKIIKASTYTNDFQKKFSEIVYMCSIYSFLFFPLYMFRLEFSRIFRDLFIVINCLVALALCIQTYDGRYLTLSRDKIELGICHIILLGILYYFGIHEAYDSVVQPLFLYNIFY